MQADAKISIEGGTLAPMIARAEAACERGRAKVDSPTSSNRRLSREQARLRVLEETLARLRAQKAAIVSDF